MKAKLEENIFENDLQDVDQINSLTVGEAMEKSQISFPGTGKNHVPFLLKRHITYII